MIIVANVKPEIKRGKFWWRVVNENQYNCSKKAFIVLDYDIFGGGVCYVTDVGTLIDYGDDKVTWLDVIQDGRKS